MKKRWKILAGILCIVLTGTACAQKKVNDGEDQQLVVNKTGKEENENQSKLDMLRPIAYSNVENLNLEPGSYISIIGRNSGDSYWDEVKAGAERAVSDINTMLGYKGDDKIRLNFSGPSEGDNVDEQINILDEELARYPIAIGISAVDATACEVQFDLAAENDIPVVAFDSGSEYQGVVATCSTNNEAAAKTAAEKLASMVDETGEVALIMQDSKSMNAKEREKGFREKMAEAYPEIKIVDVYYMDQLEKTAKTVADEKNASRAEGEEEISAELVTQEDAVKYILEKHPNLKEIVDVYYMDQLEKTAKTVADEKNASRAEGEEEISAELVTQEDAVKYILEKHPNLKGICATNLNATKLVTDVLSELEREDMSVVAFDGGSEQMKLLEEGKVNGLIIQNPYGMGYATVVAAARDVLELGNEAMIDSGYTWVTKDNMDKSAIKRMLY